VSGQDQDQCITSDLQSRAVFSVFTAAPVEYEYGTFIFSVAVVAQFVADIQSQTI